MPVPQVTIEQYLRSLIPNMDFDENVILVAMSENGIEIGELSVQPDRGEEWQRRKDLAAAMIYEAASGLINTSGETIKVGNRTFNASSVQTAEETRLSWLRKANQLRKKWGLAPLETTNRIYDASFMWKRTNRARRR